MSTDLDRYASRQTPLCPDCGQPMRLYGRGATRKKHEPRWICRAAEAELRHDENDHLKWVKFSIHDPSNGGHDLRSWTPEQLEAL